MLWSTNRRRSFPSQQSVQWFGDTLWVFFFKFKISEFFNKIILKLQLASVNSVAALSIISHCSTSANNNKWLSSNAFWPAIWRGKSDLSQLCVFDAHVASVFTHSTETSSSGRLTCCRYQMSILTLVSACKSRLRRVWRMSRRFASKQRCSTPAAKLRGGFECIQSVYLSPTVFQRWCTQQINSALWDCWAKWLWIDRSART